MKPAQAHRNHPAYWAFLLHRLSGLALILFLPLHFLVLGMALQGNSSLDEVIRWTDNPWVKTGEWILVTLLALHLAGGLRVLALEFLPWSTRQKTWIALSAAASLFVGLIFLLNLIQ